MYQHQRRSTITLPQAVQTTLYPVSVASGANAGVYGDGVVQGRPLDGSIPFAELAYVKPFPFTRHTRQRELLPFRLRDGPKHADGDSGDDVERYDAAKDYGSTGAEGAQRLRNHVLEGRVFSGAFRRTARVQ